MFAFIFCEGAAHVRIPQQTPHLGRVTKTVQVTFLHCPSAASTTPTSPGGPCSALPDPSTACPTPASSHHPADCETLSITLKNTTNPPIFNLLFLSPFFSSIFALLFPFTLGIILTLLFNLTCNEFKYSANKLCKRSSHSPIFLSLCSYPSSLPPSYNSSLCLLKSLSPTLHHAQAASKRVCNSKYRSVLFESSCIHMFVCVCVFCMLDMVELMLMQNAQMHQIIMHNMMLKAMPPIALSPPGGPSHCAPCAKYLGQVHTNMHTLSTHKDKAKSLNSDPLQNCPKSVAPGQFPGKPYFCTPRCQTKRKCCPSSSSLWSYFCGTTAAPHQQPYMATRGVICPSRTSSETSTIHTPRNSPFYTPTTQW